MTKESEPEIGRIRYNALSNKATIRLGARDICFDPETGRVIMDSGPLVPHGDDFRSVGEQLSDGDLDILDLTLFARHYEAHPERFVKYE